MDWIESSVEVELLFFFSKVSLASENAINVKKKNKFEKAGLDGAYVKGKVTCTWLLKTQKIN